MLFDFGLFNQVVFDFYLMVVEVLLLVEGYVEFQNCYFYLFIFWFLQDKYNIQLNSIKIKKGLQVFDDDIVFLIKNFLIF